MHLLIGLTRRCTDCAGDIRSDRRLSGRKGPHLPWTANGNPFVISLNRRTMRLTIRLLRTFSG